MDPKKKRLEVEVLLDKILTLEKERKVELSDSLQPLLLAEALTDRSNGRSNTINQRLKRAARNLRETEGVSIRRADKTAAIVLINTQEYYNKLDLILGDETKFKKIRKNPVDDIKREANGIIERINASTNAVRFPLITGDYEPGYLYGTVKTHKNGNPLRPIISQVPTPTYNLAKQLNKILTPFIPKRFCIESSMQFLESIKNTPSNTEIASIDVESLFTNVPVDETIQLILERVYGDTETPSLKIPRPALKSLLELCTKKAPFTSHRGDLYTQIDGVAMGSPLGVLFANFYMGSVEERVFTTITPPPTYCRYVDDTFVAVNKEEDISHLIEKFKENSVLQFTSERPVEGKLPFLDILVNKENDSFATSVYRKPTDAGLCLNGDSECPDRYKNSVIDTYIRRALSHCSTWKSTDREIEHSAQILVNNGFSNKHINKRIRTTINNWYNPTPRENKTELKLFYRGYFHRNHKQDEAALRKIVRENVTPTEENTIINLNIYYKNPKTANLLIKNNPAPPPGDLKKANVIYQFKCQEMGCAHTYIGMTTTRLSKRISSHLQEGNILKHYKNVHNFRPSRESIIPTFKIVDSATDHKRLRFLEALHILEKKPTLNVTQETFLLPLIKHRRI